MAKTIETKNHEKMTTTLGKTTVFKGIMRFSKPLKIDGRFEGTIESDGFLYIEEGAQVQADIKVGSIVIAGVIHGNIEARENLEMLSTGQVYGNVKTAKLRIADGVIFQGKCEMLKQTDTVDIFTAPASKLKEIVKPA